MRLLPFALLTVFASPVLHAQVLEAYGTLALPHVSGVRTGGAAPDYTTSSYWAPGFGGGVTFNVIPVGPVHLGFDLRGSTKPNANGLNTVLAGVKVGFHPPVLKIKPYVEAAGGYFNTRAKITSGAPSGATESDSFAGYQVLAGVDVPIAPFFYFRAVEIGGGKAYNVKGVGDTAGNYNINVFTINTGLVFHF